MINGIFFSDQIPRTIIPKQLFTLATVNINFLQTEREGRTGEY